jgi:hypothetical protein
MGSDLNSTQENILWRWSRESHKESESGCLLDIRTRSICDIGHVLLSNNLRGPRCLCLYPRGSLGLSQPVYKVEWAFTALILCALFNRCNCGQGLYEVWYYVILLEDPNWINAMENTWGANYSSRPRGYDLALNFIQTILRVDLCPAWKLVGIGSVRLIRLEVRRWRVTCYDRSGLGDSPGKTVAV